MFLENICCKRFSVSCKFSIFVAITKASKCEIGSVAGPKSTVSMKFICDGRH